MGNQNSSSGLLAEEKASERDDANEVVSPNNITIQEDEQKEDADSEANITPLVLQNPAFASEKEVSKEQETVAVGLPKAPNGHVEPHESIFEEKMLNNVENQLLTSKEDMQIQDVNEEPKSTEIVTFTPQQVQKSRSPKQTAKTVEAHDNVQKHQPENNNVTADIVSVNGELSDADNGLPSHIDIIENDAMKETILDDSTSARQAVTVLESNSKDENHIHRLLAFENEESGVLNLPPVNQEIDYENGEKHEVETDSIPSLANEDFFDEVMTKEESTLESRPSEVLLQNKDSITMAQNEDEEIILIHRTSNVLEKGKENIEGEKRVFEDREAKEEEIEKVSEKPRKFPSFDFGIPFDARFEESDQTPLLYHDGTRIRSFSGSCSTLRVQNRSVQTEYFEKPLDIEGMEVEEKTIRMERSHSDGLKTENADITSKPNGEDRFSDNREIGFEVSEEDCGTKGREKRKVRSSLFMNCICCTEAIN